MGTDRDFRSRISGWKFRPRRVVYLGLAISGGLAIATAGVGYLHAASQSPSGSGTTAAKPSAPILPPSHYREVVDTYCIGCHNERLKTASLAEEQSGRELPTLTRPAGVPDTFTDHAKLMFDMQVLAFQTDLTRVITFMMGREFGGRTYREIGIPEGYHALTHHMYNPVKIAKVIQIQTYHAKHFAYYLDRLSKTPDGDGSLLDHMTVLYGGGISDGNSHLHDNLPVVLVGGASGQMKGGRHVRYPKDTPMANLLLTMLNTVGVHQDKLGDSTGKLTV